MTHVVALVAHHHLPCGLLLVREVILRMAVLALRALWTETKEVVLTCDLLEVLVPASGSYRSKNK